MKKKMTKDTYLNFIVTKIIIKRIQIMTKRKINITINLKLTWVNIKEPCNRGIYRTKKFKPSGYVMRP